MKRAAQILLLLALSSPLWVTLRLMWAFHQIGSA